jgi:hypothetical protein
MRGLEVQMLVFSPGPEETRPMTEWTKQQKNRRAYIETLAKDFLMRANFGEERFVLLDNGKVLAALDRTDSLDNDLAQFREMVKAETKKKEAEYRRRTFRR